MTLAFFILSALDLLGVLDTQITSEDRQSYIDWVHRCQHPDGGFKGFTGGEAAFQGENESDIDADSVGKKHSQWDLANIAATYFALVNLIVLGDDLGRVNVRACWTWVRRLQLVDGSFGEGIEPEGKVHGGRDVRFCYCAMGIRWALLRLRGAVVREEDIDIRAMESFIAASQVCGLNDNHHAVHSLVYP